MSIRDTILTALVLGLSILMWSLHQRIEKLESAISKPIQGPVVVTEDNAVVDLQGREVLYNNRRTQ